MAKTVVISGCTPLAMAAGLVASCDGSADTIPLSCNNNNEFSSLLNRIET